MHVPPIEMKRYSSVWQNLPPAIQMAQPQPFESFDQNQGLVLYRTTLVGHKSGTLTVHDLHDS